MSRKEQSIWPIGVVVREHPPTWAVGTTFEWEFDFPVHPNPAYDHEPEPKRTKKQPATPAAARAPARKVAKPATTVAKPKASEKPKRVRLTPRNGRNVVGHAPLRNAAS